MKKLIAALAAMIMVMAMSTSVFAANTSPFQTDDGVEGIGGDWDVIAQITDADALEELGDTEAEVEEALPGFLEDMDLNVPEGGSVDLIGAWDLESDDPKPVIVFEIASDTASDGDTVYVLHYLGDGNWELMSYEVKDGAIEVTFENGLSPVYLFIVKDADGKVTTLEAAPVEADDEKETSHKTGW